MFKLKTVFRICVDITCLLALLCVPEYAMRKWHNPAKSGFFCGDPNLSYPYHESKIDELTVLAITILAPSIIIFVNELCKQTLSPPSVSSTFSLSSLPSPSATPVSSTKLDSYQICCRFSNAYIQIGYYFFGLVVNWLFADVAKHTSGHLRPHFFAVCQPVMPDGSTCEDAANQGHYIIEYTCSSRNFTAHIVQQLAQSFPSRQTSLIFYAMIYASVYLQSAVNTPMSGLFKHELQYMFMMVAWCVALARFYSFSNHWTDAAAGMLLGAICAFIVSNYIANLCGLSDPQPAQTYEISPASSIILSSKCKRSESDRSGSTSLSSWTHKINFRKDKLTPSVLSHSSKSSISIIQAYQTGGLTKFKRNEEFY